MVTIPNELRYFQTFNKIIKRWNIPMRKLYKRQSIPIKNLKCVVSPTWGYGYAIHRMARVYDRKLDDMGRSIWKTEIRKTSNKTYIYYELRVVKIQRDFSGGCNYEVRNW